MTESIVLVEGEAALEDTLTHLGLDNAKQLFVGSVPGGRFVLHVTANTPEDLGSALLRFAGEPGVISVTPVMITNQQ